MTQKKPRFKRTPPSTGDQETTEDRGLNKFAAQAEAAPVEEEEQAREVFPWEHVSSKEKKLVSLYLPKDVAEKLKFLSEETDVPQQRIMRNVLVPEIERQVDEVLKKRGE